MGKQFRALTSQEKERIRTKMEWRLAEFCGNDFPMEGTEDGDLYEGMRELADDADSLGAFVHWFECYSAPDCVCEHLRLFDVDGIFNDRQREALDSEEIGDAGTGDETAIDELCKQFEKHYGINVWF